MEGGNEPQGEPQRHCAAYNYRRGQILLGADGALPIVASTQSGQGNTERLAHGRQRPYQGDHAAGRYCAGTNVAHVASPNVEGGKLVHIVTQTKDLSKRTPSQQVEE